VEHNPHYVSSVAEVLRPLRAPDGVVGVLGNHDHYVDAAGVRAELARAGVRELFTRAVLTRGGAQLALTGVGDLERDVIDFERALAGVPSGCRGSRCPTGPTCSPTGRSGAPD